jgi:phosphoglycolate phosphatase
MVPDSARLAIFDCDGTLVDSQANICRAMEACFLAAKLEPPTAETTRRVVGLSLVEAMKVLHPEADHDFHLNLADLYRQAFSRLRQQGLVEDALYEGTAELIETLQGEGWLLGVATGKSDRGLIHCLDRHRLRARFITLQTADRHPSKPHPSMIEAAMAEAGVAQASTMMIGDTSFDMMMAKAAGVTAVGVSWGYHADAELTAAGADYIARRPDDILTITKAIA